MLNRIRRSRCIEYQYLTKLALIWINLNIYTYIPSRLYTTGVGRDYIVPFGTILENLLRLIHTYQSLLCYRTLQTRYTLNTISPSTCLSALAVRSFTRDVSGKMARFMLPLYNLLFSINTLNYTSTPTTTLMQISNFDHICN